MSNSEELYKNMEKMSIAVFFGGKSFEHDVSILTGIGAYKLLDPEKFNAVPIYIDLENQMWFGKELLDTTIYPLKKTTKRRLSEARILIGEKKPTIQITKRGPLFSKTTKIDFDVALLALHGDYGENGPIQGMCELGGIPYTGCRLLSSAVTMNKSLTKLLVKGVGVPTLEEIIIKKPTGNEFYDIGKLTEEIKLKFPLIVKPVALGSSVGVSKASNKDELNASVLQVFALGEDAMIEPFVENLEEYNVSVTKIFNKKTTPSVIERPIKKDASFLGFVEKYLSGSGAKGGTKKAGFKFSSSRSGLISSTREFNPSELNAEQTKKLKEWATKAFDVLECNGVVRVDFLCNSKTQEFYFGELNTIPGSLSCYLWEANEPGYSYVELLTALIEEALELYKTRKGNIILSNSNSEIFKERQ
jgi:D-alanine-D-alanine ligase